MTFLNLAPFNCRSENVRVVPIVVAELKFRDIQRHIFGAHLVECANHTAFENRPKALDCIRVNRTNNVTLCRVIDRLMRKTLQAFIDAAFVCCQQAHFVRDNLANKLCAAQRQ
jgi:hypothetical protein